MALKRIGLGEVASSSLFRGEWTEDSLEWIDLFDAGINSGLWAPSAGGSGALPVWSTPPAEANSTIPPGLSRTVVMDAKNVQNTNWSRLTLDLNALGIIGATRFRCSFVFPTPQSSTTGQNRRLRILRNEAELFSKTNVEAGGHNIWNDAEVPITPMSLVGVEGRGLAGSSAATPIPIHFSNAQVYAVAKPYSIGEFVVHNGKMWKALADDASGEPGASAYWTEVPLDIHDTIEARLVALEDTIDGGEI